jgi:hypothetical protein
MWFGRKVGDGAARSTRGFRFSCGMNASWLMKNSASVRMTPFSGVLYQVAPEPTTDTGRRTRRFTIGFAKLHVAAGRRDARAPT